MNTLTDFLLARVAEDEDTARAALEWWRSDLNGGWFEGVDTTSRSHLLRHDPNRVLAECEAKRRIVGAADWEPEDDDPAAHVLRGVIGLLALPYADHPDFREEWRPL